MAVFDLGYRKPSIGQYSVAHFCHQVRKQPSHLVGPPLLAHILAWMGWPHMIETLDSNHVNKWVWFESQCAESSAVYN